MAGPIQHGSLRDVQMPAQVNTRRVLLGTRACLPDNQAGMLHMLYLGVGKGGGGGGGG